MEERPHWTAAALGQRIKLTLAKQIRLNIRGMHPFDVSKKNPCVNNI